MSTTPVFSLSLSLSLSPSLPPSLSLSISPPFSQLHHRKFEKLSELMSEEYNWKHYRAELETCFTENLPCIPFLGVLLTTIVQHESATTSRGVKMSLSRNGRKRVSGVEMYTILEAITVRNRSVVVVYTILLASFPTAYNNIIASWLSVYSCGLN